MFNIVALHQSVRFCEAEAHEDVQMPPMPENGQYRSRLFFTLVEEPLKHMERELREVKTVRFLCDYPWPSGKRLRPITFLLSLLSVRVERSISTAMNGRESKLAAAIELMHEASLVHDDIVDRSELRRGVPTMQSLNGDGLALLIGDYMVFRGLKMVLDSAETRTDIMLAQELANTGLSIAHGEADQLSRYIHHHSIKDRMSFSAYIDLIAKKTASFFAGCAEAGAALAGADKAHRQVFRDFGMNMGIVFQVMDDLIDIYGDAEVAKKSLRNNLNEGTVTLPMIHAWELYPNDRALRAFVAGRELSEKQQNSVYERLAARNVRLYCEKTIKRYVRSVETNLGKMPVNIYTSGLADLFAYVQQCSWGGFDISQRSQEKSNGRTKDKGPRGSP